LATQNPMDLDYKALSNAGTWFVGKLQTDRDKARLVEGLQGVAAESGTLADADYLDSAISALGNRVFLLHDVRGEATRLFHTRWALSYLYGPLTRDQVAEVMAPVKAALGPAQAGAAAHAAPRACGKCHTPAPARARFCMECGAPLPRPAETPPEVSPAEAGAPSHVPPVLPPGLAQFFLPAQDGAGPLQMEPRLLGFAEVLFNDRRRKLEYQRAYRLLAPPPDAAHPEPWRRAEEVPEELAASPGDAEAVWADVPETVNDPKKLRGLNRALVHFLYNNATMTVYHNASLGLLSKPGEDRQAFLQRCREAAEQEARQGEGESAPPFPDAGAAPREAAKAARRADREKAKRQRKAEGVKEVHLRPRKADIRVTHFGLAWAPFRRAAEGDLRPAYVHQPIPPESWRGAGVSQGVEAV
jgi:hypothetical protein